MTLNQLEKALLLQNEFNAKLAILNNERIELEEHCYSAAPLGKTFPLLANAVFAHLERVFDETQEGLRQQLRQNLEAL